MLSTEPFRFIEYHVNDGAWCNDAEYQCQSVGFKPNGVYRVWGIRETDLGRRKNHYGDQYRQQCNIESFHQLPNLALRHDCKLQLRPIACTKRHVYDYDNTRQHGHIQWRERMHDRSSPNPTNDFHQRR